MFWEGRLDEDWTETGVGYRALGRRFNTWMYRVRREVFLREVGSLDLDWPRTRVLDVGSGTGFYVQAWRDLGAGSVTGCDLTQAAVDRLGVADGVGDLPRLLRCKRGEVPPVRR